ncbi:MAG: hypothetical protein QXG57_08805 [Thermofilaceae archaeon]
MIELREVEVEGRRVDVLTIDLRFLDVLEPGDACWTLSGLAAEYDVLFRLLDTERVWVETSYRRRRGVDHPKHIPDSVARAIADAVEMLLRGEGLERLEEKHGRWAARRAASLLRGSRTVVRLVTGTGNCYDLMWRRLPKRVRAALLRR